MARTVFYDIYGKFIAERGSGASLSRRMIDRSTYRDIVFDEARVRRFVASENLFGRQKVGTPLSRSIVQREHSRSHWLRLDEDLVKANTPTEDPVDRELSAASQELIIQQNSALVIAQLVQAQLADGNEHGAYITLPTTNFSTDMLQFRIAQPRSSTPFSINWDIATAQYAGFGPIALLPGDPTQHVIGTVHTHYPPAEALEALRKAGRKYTPGISPDDQASARDNRFVVYAVDANHVHKATPSGRISNNLLRDMDILTDALATYSRA